MTTKEVTKKVLIEIDKALSELSEIKNTDCNESAKNYVVRQTLEDAKMKILRLPI